MGHAVRQRQQHTRLLSGVKRLADAYGTAVTIHHSSASRVRERFLADYGSTPIGFLSQINVLAPNMLLAHANGIDDRKSN